MPKRQIVADVPVKIPDNAPPERGMCEYSEFMEAAYLSHCPKEIVSRYRAMKQCMIDWQLPYLRMEIEIGHRGGHMWGTKAREAMNMIREKGNAARKMVVIDEMLLTDMFDRLDAALSKYEGGLGSSAAKESTEDAVKK